MSAEWSQHPNYHGSMASMLIRIHEGFRGASEQLVAWAEVLAEAPELWGRMRRTYVMVARALHHHHAIEEATMFPYLVESGKADPAALYGDHEELMAQIDAVSALLDAAEPEPERIVVGLRELQAVLVSHLDDEEALVVPILLEMSPAEMQAMLHR